MLLLLFVNIIKFDHEPFHIDKKDSFIIVIPVQKCSEVELAFIVLKAKGAKITKPEFLKVFQTKVKPEFATMQLIDNDKFILTKTKNDNKMLFLNNQLRRALTYKHSAMFHKGIQQYMDGWFEEWNEPWILSILTVKSTSTYHEKL